MRATLSLNALLTACGLCAAAAAWAQPAAPLVREEPARDRTNQRIQRIHLEDAGSRVDELRVGGETQSITVQPKANVPAYDVRPAGATRPVQIESAPGSAGPRTWKVLHF